nr:MAG TPA: hypothetical protein [Bacteriophage sp.]
MLKVHQVLLVKVFLKKHYLTVRLMLKVMNGILNQ